MKKHLVAILILVLVLALAGTGIYFIVKQNNTKPLYEAHCEFVLSDDTTTLTSKMTEAQNLYNSVLSSETRLTTLNSVITKIDSFERDLNSYLILNTTKAKSTKNLSKTYANLTTSRKTLIKDYNEYITRMSGDLNADGPAIQKLYNDIFNKTVDYLYDYNNCFLSTSNFVFDKVYKIDTIKNELYILYSLGVNDLLNYITNNQFSSTTLINRLNNGIVLENNNLHITSGIEGGEFSTEALNFKKYFNSSNLTILINNFNTYYSESINVNTETSNEKLAVYYAKQILEI